MKRNLQISKQNKNTYIPLLLPVQHGEASARTDRVDEVHLALQHGDGDHHDHHDQNGEDVEIRDGALCFDINCRVDGDVNDEVEEDDLHLQQVGKGWHVFVVQTMPFNLKNTYVK